MYVIVQHRFRDPQAALSRGERLIKNEGAPSGVRGLQFYPSTDRAAATCLWEADSVESVRQVRRLDARGHQREHLLRGRR